MPELVEECRIALPRLVVDEHVAPGANNQVEPLSLKSLVSLDPQTVMEVWAVVGCGARAGPVRDLPSPLSLFDLALEVWFSTCKGAAGSGRVFSSFFVILTAGRRWSLLATCSVFTFLQLGRV